MKLTVILMLAAVLQVSAKGYSQEKISVNFENVKLSKALKAIEKKSDFRFVYSNLVLNGKSRVTLSANNVEVKDLLRRMLRDLNLTYISEPNNLIIIKGLQENVKDIIVKGRVVNAATGEPISGATVQIKGSNVGTSTGDDGSYSITAPDDGILVFTTVGFVSQEIRINGRTNIDVGLNAMTTDLEEVVVVGYGTTKKSDLTGSVGSLKESQIQERPVSSLNEAMAGQIPGVQVNTNSGRPGGQTNVRIRGFSSISSSNNPLFVIDGVYLPTGTQTEKSNSIDYINPGDIASVEVLKDASATAIYGARGANGVILITTKKGTPGKPKVRYDGTLFVNALSSQRVHMLNAQEYLQIEDLAYDNIKIFDPEGWANGNYSSVVDPREKRKNLPLLFDSKGDPLYNTDWLKASTTNKLSQSHQLNVSGGSENTTYNASVGYRDENGLLLNSYLKRYSGRFNIDSKVNDWLRIGGSLAYNNQNENIVDQGTGSLNSVRMITEGFPFLPVKYPDGTWAENWQYPGAEGGSNPVHQLTERKFIVNTQTTLGDLYSNIQLTKDLMFRSQLGISVVDRGTNQYASRTLDQISRDQNGTASVSNSRENYWSIENYFTYNKKVADKHEFNGVLGLSWQGTNYFSIGASSQNFSTDYFQYNNIGAGSQQNPGSSNRSGYAFNSYYGRINYVYDSKYLFTFTGRADGSSKFGMNHQYAFFPSAALAWRVSQEDFLKDSKVISNLKLRASYGNTGNSEIPPYSSDALLSSSYAAIINGQRVTGIGTNRLANPDLRWEKTAQTDVGAEFALFNFRVNIEADYYYRKTTDMLLAAPVPRSSGYSSIFKNVGSMENKGFELTINTLNVSTQHFSWNTTLNFSSNKNKVLSLATPAPIFSGNPNFLSNTGIIQVGQPVGSFYGLVRLGVWTEAERAEAAKFASYRGGKPILPGDLKYLDVNGDYVINDADRMIIGHGAPKGWGSFINTLKYKQFGLLLDLQYTYGNDVLNMTHHSGEDRVGIANSFNSVLNAYDPAKGNDNTMIAQIRDTRAGYVTNVDSHWIEDGSFIRGRNLMLSYDFASSLVEKMHLSNMRAYISTQNFFIITKYKGNDPEVTTYGDAFAQGQTFFDYPKPTTYTFGVSVGF